MNVFLSGTCLCSELIEILKEKSIEIENNFEQVFAMAKLGKINKLCIFMDADNCSYKKFNCIRGQGAAELIHSVNKNIPILIWDGKEYVDADQDLPPIFQIGTKQKPVKNNNEMYLSFAHYNKTSIEEITMSFFENTLTDTDIKIKDCLEFKF